MSARETIAVAREPSASGYVGAVTHLFDQRLASDTRPQCLARLQGAAAGGHHLPPSGCAPLEILTHA